MLNMIDLGYNKIEKQSSLVGLVNVNTISMINLCKNSVMNGDWKALWTNSIDINKIYQMDHLYVTIRL